MTPRFRPLHDPRIDVPTLTRLFLQNPMMRNSTTLIPALTLWVNAHNTVLAHYSNGTRVSEDAWSKLPQDSQNIWMSLPIDDRKLILGASDFVSSITKASSLLHAIQGQRWTWTLNLN
jgi:hypothetical protein